MQISKDSWHYKFNFSSQWCQRMIFDYKPRDLCNYIQQTLMNMLLVFAMCLGVFVMSGLVFTLTIYDPIMMFVEYDSTKGFWYQGHPGIIGLTLEAAALFVTGFYFAQKKIKEIRRNRRPKEYVYKKPGIVKQAYSDFKEKTCTLIEYD